MTASMKDGKKAKRQDGFTLTITVKADALKPFFEKHAKHRADALRASEEDRLTVPPDMLIIRTDEPYTIRGLVDAEGQAVEVKTADTRLNFPTTFAPLPPRGFRCVIAGEVSVIDLRDITEEGWSRLAEDITKRNADQSLTVPEGKPKTTAALVPTRSEYVKTSGRLFDTPRLIEAKHQEELLPEIGRWYAPQTAFNRSVGMAAAALTKMKTHEAILDWQTATVGEIEDLVFWREDGTPAHGQHREDILKAFEALRAIPVPIVWIDWKKVGTRYVKQYKLRVGSLLQSYGAVFEDRTTGKKALAADPGRRKDLKKSKADRRKKTRALIEANPAEGLLKAFPADKYKLTGFEWRWNTDIAEDFICPQVALDAKGRPRLKMKKGRHIEGRRFIMLNREYFAVQKNLRDAGMTYAPRLLDVIVSEKTHITSRVGGAVWIEIEAGKVIKWLGLWTDYQDRPKHVEEDHVAPAITALITEKVLLSASDTLPRTDPNPDRRKKPYYRWKVAERWTTVALVPEDEARDIEDELVKEAETSEATPKPDVRSKAGQAVLPGMEETPGLPIPSGTDIRAARKAAGLNLRDFARKMDGREAVLAGKQEAKPSFKTWSMIETGQRTTSAGRISEAVWQRVRDFIGKHGPKADLSHDRCRSVT